MRKQRILLFANNDWYLYNFRRSLASRLRQEGWQVLLVSPPGRYALKLQADGFRWIPFPFSAGGMNPLEELGVVRRLIALYQKERPDLVHHFTVKCVLYGSMAAQWAGAIPTVNAVTGLGHLFTGAHGVSIILRNISKILYRLVLANPNCRVIFQNEEDLDFFLSHGLVDGRRTHLIRGSGVDCNLFHPMPPPAPEVPKVLFASRMLREKGVVELLHAIRRLKGKGIAAEFVFAGAPYPDNPSSLTGDEVSSIRNEGMVTWLGHVENMVSLLAQASIVVLPSYREGTPRILIEAAAMGKAIVATDIAGCRGVVRHDVNGLLVPVGDSVALAAALEKVVLDKALRNRLGAAGRSIVLSTFDEEIILRQTFEVYTALLAAATGRQAKA